MLVQRTWRGYVDRAFVQCLRREAYQKSIAAAKYRARLELKARIVQGAWRRRQAKQVRIMSMCVERCSRMRSRSGVIEEHIA